MSCYVLENSFFSILSLTPFTRSFIVLRCELPPHCRSQSWHRIAPQKYDIKTHKYSRVNTCYYYFALFYTILYDSFPFLSLVSSITSHTHSTAQYHHRDPKKEKKAWYTPKKLREEEARENPFFNFPQFFCHLYIHGIIFNFSIIKYASVFDTNRRGLSSES